MAHDRLTPFRALQAPHAFSPQDIPTQHDSNGLFKDALSFLALGTPESTFQASVALMLLALGMKEGLPAPKVTAIKLEDIARPTVRVAPNTAAFLIG